MSYRSLVTKFKELWLVIFLTWVGLLLITSLTVAQSVIYVNQTGAAAPTGTSAKPYHLIEAGVCKAEFNQTILIRAGNYNERLLINRHVRLNASGGNVVIGRVANKPQTTLKVLTYNTHLFGDEALNRAPQFVDKRRARLFAKKIRNEDAEVIGLTEVWDEELAALLMRSVRDAFPFSYYSNEHHEYNDILNSGLLLLSRIPLSNEALYFYTVESGGDAWASKGFINATVEKDGFEFGIFLTHTQAWNGPDAVTAREKQLRQLRATISNYRLFHPNAEIIAMGDFNVIGGLHLSYYNDKFLPIMDLKDAFVNAPCYHEKQDKFRYTYHQQNDLVQIFDPPGSNERLDYVLYSHAQAFTLLPLKAVVKRYRVSHPINKNGKLSNDLSDHYGVWVEFAVFR